MSKKPTVTTISSGYYSTTALNNNFTNIRDKFDNTLSLDGSTPNSMAADIDLNNNDLLNVNELNASEITLDGTSIAAQADAAAASASDAADSATEAAGYLERNVHARPANFNVLTSERADVYRVTSPVTASLPAVATAGDGFWFTLIADGADVTIDPDGAELIDAASTLTVKDGTAVDVFCDGSDWRTTKPFDQALNKANSPEFTGLAIDTDTLYVDSANNRVGVGTTSPSEALHVIGEIQSDDGTGSGSYALLRGLASDSHLFLHDTISRKVKIDTTTNDNYVVEGNFGLGTFTPSEKLEVEGNAQINSKLGVNGSTGAAQLTVTGDEGTGEVIATLAADLPVTGARSINILAPETDSASAPFVFSTGNSYIFRVDATDALTIADDGKVGVGGITNPSDPLTVSGKASATRISASTGASGFGGSGPAFQFTGDEDTGIARVAANTLAIGTGGSERMRIASDGDVGIGTTSPDADLDVAGVIANSGGATNGRGLAMFHQNNINASCLSRFESGSVDANNRILWDFDDDSFTVVNGGNTSVTFDSNAHATFGGAVITDTTTVASLPSASTLGAGARHFVTDANATTFASVVAGGGSNGVPVYSDGTDWRIG